MALPTNIEVFLEDIPGPKPQGEWLRYSNEYDMIREAMRFDNPDLPLGVWLTNLKTADWRKTASMCETILKNKSKDLQIAAWLIEAWIHLYSMAGVQQGFTLLNALSQKYWESAYPPLSEEAGGDLAFHVSPFVWTNSKLSKRISKVLITEPQNVGDKPYSFQDWVQLTQLQGLYPQGDRPKNRGPIEQVGGDKVPTLLDFDTNLLKTDSEFYRTLYTQINDTLDTCTTLEGFLRDKCGTDAPSLFNVKKALQDILKFTVQTLYDRGIHVNKDVITNPNDNFENPAGEGVVSPPQQPDEFVTVKGVPMTSDSPSNTSAPPPPGFTSTEPVQQFIQNRDAAYKQINDAADYLSKIEPHSPVPYLIKRAVSWRNKSFMDLMKEMVPNSGGMDDLNRLLGLPTGSSGGSSSSSSK